ncbi:MAG: hypothetical protein M1826_006676 [Phylliscum demangeonii]|nr:MAG: hypothetical protein M1826_006676 [Phylliscum demangeonii]
MEEEEQQMAQKTVQDEEQRQERLQQAREEDLQAGEEVVDSKFKRLQFLLGQSEVYSSILMSKIKEQREAAKAAEEKKPPQLQPQPQSGKRAAANETDGPTPATRRTTRAGAETQLRAEGKTAAGGEDGGQKKPSSRAKGKKKEAKTIANYFGSDGLAPAGGASVATALEQAADQAAAHPTSLGAQPSRSARQPDLVTGGTMRGYQLEGLEWLTSLYENGLNGILADEMGLGKTVQTIAFLAFLRSKKTYGPFLIAAPLSTLGNWVDEFHRWTPDIPVLLYHGTKPEREELRQTRLVAPGGADFPVVCTSYEICMNDRKYLARYGWKFVIIVSAERGVHGRAAATTTTMTTWPGHDELTIGWQDEGHRLKNLNCRLVRELKSYNSANRLLITGTPLQNNLAELWSLLNFLMPEIFDQLDAFESWFDFSALKERDGHEEILVGERKHHIIASLHAILKPFLLRRVKADVEASLPKKREYILYAPLTAEQQELYRHILAGTSRAYLEEKMVATLTTRARATTAAAAARGAKRKRTTTTTTNGPREAVESEEFATPGNKSAKSSSGGTPADGIRSRTSGKKRPNYRDPRDDEDFGALERSAPDAVLDHDNDSNNNEAIEKAKTLQLAKRAISAKKLQNPMMQLRLACNSPHNFYWPWHDEATDPPDARLITASGKMMLLERLMPALLARGHRVLIFSQFTSQLDILEDWATVLHRWAVCRIDGGVPAAERRRQIAAFHHPHPDNADNAPAIFLLSTRAGGQGINLAAADTVVLFDSDWNPQQDLQAQDRAHRIGQTRPVIVYRLATRATVEQALLDRADGKRRLEKVVIRPGRFRGCLPLPHAPRPPVDDLDDLRRLLAVHDANPVDARPQLLTDRDLELLTDRSDEAYARAEMGLDAPGRQSAFEVVDSKPGSEGVLMTMTTAAAAAPTPVKRSA